VINRDRNNNVVKIVIEQNKYKDIVDFSYLKFLLFENFFILIGWTAVVLLEGVWVFQHYFSE